MLNSLQAFANNCVFCCKIFNSVQSCSLGVDHFHLNVNVYIIMFKLYSTVQYSAVLYSTVQCCTVQYSAVKYSTVQYSTVQYSAVHCTVYFTMSNIFMLLGQSLLSVKSTSVQYFTVHCTMYNVKFIHVLNIYSILYIYIISTYILQTLRDSMYL